MVENTNAAATACKRPRVSIGFILAFRRKLLAALLSCGVLALGVGTASAAPGRSDYDLDDDRLIEIDDLFDLDQIRNNLDGTTFWGEPPEVLGCPGGCIGFELNADLNLDTNGNGEFDPGDVVYNGGLGWTPIGGESTPFTAEFHGDNNGVQHYLDKFPCRYRNACGLFGYAQGATFDAVHMRDVHIRAAAAGANGAIVAFLTSGAVTRSAATGTIDGGEGTGTGGLVGWLESGLIDESYASVDIIAGNLQGGLVGVAAFGSTIQRSFATGRVTSGRRHWNSGGLVGDMEGSSIDNCFATGNVGVSTFSGGLVGTVDGLESGAGPSTITNSFATGNLIGPERVRGGLVGYGDVALSFSYWATDLTGESETAGTGGRGLLGSQLRCPQAPFGCGLGNIYQGWALEVNSSGAPLWNFGSNQQLPALNIQGGQFRDSDGDGVLDSQDYYPLNYAASKNTDGDMSHDRWKEGCDQACRDASGLTLDQFPDNIAASVDLDLDGQPDAWNPLCFAACRASSGLTLDPFPGDQDDDGVPDAVDDDDDGLGGVDVDADSDGLVDIGNADDLDLVRYAMRGYGRRTTDPIFEEDGTWDDAPEDASGCAPRIHDGVLARYCRGYELTADIDFDENQNGLADDAYTAGDGWYPIGTAHDPFLSAFLSLFEGNGHVIRNLVIGLTSEHRGLFGAIQHAEVRNLGIDGPMTVINVANRGGVLAGAADNSVIRDVYVTGRVVATEGGSVGGLVGRSFGSSITGAMSTVEVEALYPCAGGCGLGGLVGTLAGGGIAASFATGSVQGDWTDVGGLVGQVVPDIIPESTATIEASYSTGNVVGDAPVGGFVGSIDSPGSVTPVTYWATDSSGQPSSAGTAVGASLAQLQCPESPADASCGNPPLYSGWGSFVGPSGSPYWDFGDASELPGLCLGGSVYRDGDADGALDPIESCGPAPGDPCAGICSNPQPISWMGGSSNNNNLGTGALCFEVNQPIAGGNCGNFAPGRQLRINGVVQVCNGQNWVSAPSAPSDEYCLSAPAGDWSGAFITLW